MRARPYLMRCDPVTCPYMTRIGGSVFHVHTNALGTATYDNKKAGRKVAKVVVRGRHFHVIPA